MPLPPPTAVRRPARAAPPPDGRRRPATGLRLAGITALLGVLALAAPAQVGAAPLRYAEDQAPGILNPLFTTTMSEVRANELIFEGLYGDDRNLASAPVLATGITVADDRLSADVQLRQGVRWHDGRPFSAEDVAFTIRAMKDPGTLSTEAGRVAFISGVEVIDGQTLRLRFARPEPAPEEKLHFKILPAHAFSGTAVQRSDPFRAQPIGTGPYRFVRFNSDNSVTLAAHAENRKPPRIPEVTLREVADKNYQAKLLLYETLEALVRVLPRDLAILQNNRGVELHPYQTNAWWYLGFNLSRPTWADPRAREALALMVDRQALLAPVGTGDLLSGPFVRSSPYYNHEVSDWRPDPAKAAALLEAAGYRRDGASWTRNGQPLTLQITAPKGLESAQEVVINLQSQLQAQGVKVEVRFLDEASWKANIWRAKDFDLVVSQWSFDRNEDVREQLHSKGTRNFVGYKNPAADALLDKAQAATTPAEKKAALRELHGLVHNDVPMVFLWTLDSYAAMSVKVREVVVHPFSFFSWVRDWQIK
jgi:peptide/nickel transport system substrate-binding protein